MKKITFFILAGCLSFSGYSQAINADSTSKNKKTKIKSIESHPVLNAGDGSGVFSVKNPTEIPDPALNYKLLFDLTKANPDSLTQEINSELKEVARIINLHVASGIPMKKIFPVIVMHGSILNAMTNNKIYKEKYKVDNPNIKLINDLSALGVKFIACGQAMHFQDINTEALLPQIKVSVTAQTALSYYQLKGYVKF